MLPILITCQKQKPIPQYRIWAAKLTNIHEIPKITPIIFCTK